VILLVLIVEESISSLKVIVRSLDIEISVAPLEGEVDEIVGAVVSGTEDVVKFRLELDAKAFPDVSLTPVVIVTV
jgi:hypothetical protein